MNSPAPIADLARPLTRCHECRHWRRGSEHSTNPGRSGWGDCIEPGMLGVEQKPDRTRWDDACERGEPKS